MFTSINRYWDQSLRTADLSTCKPVNIISPVVAGLAMLKLPGCPPLFQSLSCSSRQISHKARYSSLSTSISCHGTCWKLPENYCRRQFSAVPLAGAGSEKLLQFTQGKLELSLGGGHSKYLYKFLVAVRFWFRGWACFMHCECFFSIHPQFRL